MKSRTGVSKGRPRPRAPKTSRGLRSLNRSSESPPQPLEQALRDAGIARLRPVLVTVAATILALFPLAIHGGPLWKPLCYAQIGGLTVATFITLLLVPVLYSLAILDLKIIRWEEHAKPHEANTRLKRLA